MEFVVPAADPNSFFPIDVKFTANKTFCDIKVGSLLYYWIPEYSYSLIFQIYMSNTFK